jgi:hypothetical protein
MKDIHIQLASAADATELVAALCERLPFEWKRDGILEAQVSTREDVQYCFRYEPDDSRPRCALVLAGPGDELTVAVVVPIDRGVDLSDDAYDSVVEDFWQDVMAPLVDEGSSEGAPVDVRAELVDRDAS